jgi:hypothetical protein
VRTQRVFTYRRRAWRTTSVIPSAAREKARCPNPRTQGRRQCSDRTGRWSTSRRKDFSAPSLMGNGKPASCASENEEAGGSITGRGISFRRWTSAPLPPMVCRAPNVLNDGARRVAANGEIKQRRVEWESADGAPGLKASAPSPSDPGRCYRRSQSSQRQGLSGNRRSKCSSRRSGVEAIHGVDDIAKPCAVR